MADDAMAGLFGEDESGDSTADHALYEQDGPDLFGMDADELILPTEPTPIDDPEMEIELDQMEEIPIDPDEDAADASVVDESIEDEPHAVAPQIAPEPHATPRRADAPLALYRRYRPETFDQVIGEEHVTEPLKRALLNNRVNHAYLFSGPRGCGKTTSARILARCLNCAQGPTPNPCGVCQSCRDLARGGSGSIDVIEIDAASHGGVDEARDLRERAFFAPVHSRYKIYIIDEAHMVTNAGFNALLKVVEEPPPHVKFIFATTEPEKVIGTIRSRTHHYPFRLVPPRTLTTYLGELCEAEGVQVDHSVLPLVVRAGAGSVRDSLSVLDQLLGGAGGEGVTYTQAASLLGYTPESLLDEIVDAFAAGDAQGVFACIDKVMEVGQDPRRFGEDLLRRLRDLIIVAAVPDALETGLVDVAADQAERLTTQAAGMGAGELTRAAEVIAQGLTDMRGTTAPRLHLELMCARVLLPGADVDARGVHARLDRVERRLQMLPGADTEPPHAAPAPPARPEAPWPGERPAEPSRPRGEQPAGGPRDTADAAARTPGQGVEGARPAAEPAAAPSPRPSERPAAQQPPAAPAPAPEAPAERGVQQQVPAPQGAAGQGGPAEPARHDEPAGRPSPQHPEPGAQPAAPQPEPGAQRPQASGGGEPGARPAASGEQPQAGGWSVNVPARQPVQERPAEQPVRQAPPTGGADPSHLSTADIRARWPEVLDAVRGRRRVTWIILRENAQVQAFADGVLTLALNNPGALESFSRGGSDHIVREAVLEVFGVAPTVHVVPGDGGPEVEPERPAAPHGPQHQQTPPAPDDVAPNPYAEQARANIQPLQSGPVAEEAGAQESRDDVTLDDERLDSSELLVKVLGAELISDEGE